MPEAVLELENVSKSYGTFHAVQDISFSLERGRIYGFLGPNGAGKTTTIRMILDIIRPSSGRITVLGAQSPAAVRNRLGYLPEEKGLYKKMKAWALIAYFATLKGMSRREAKATALELLRRHGLGDFAEKRTEALSKGMGQKVQVLASIAHKPEFVILDEPFSGLDPVNQEVMEEIMRDMVRQGATILFSTHVMQHAERLCERILLISGGKKIFEGAIAEAKRKMPRVLRLETDLNQNFEGFAAVERVVRNVHEDKARWEIALADSADPQALLQDCFVKGVRLHSFELSEPSLHDVFMHLVGPEAREAKLR